MSLSPTQEKPTILNPIYLASLSLLLGFALGYSAHRVYSSQNRGESLVRKALQKHFRSPNYHLLNHITLKHGDSTTQIDHILVSCFGVFVIETKNYKGWIFANPKHESWTQVLFKAKFKFQNPNREGLRIEVGRSISSLRVTRIMSELVEFYGKPLAIRLDNGPELTAESFTEWAKEQGIELRFIQPGKPNQNAFIERFNKSFREEVLNANLFNTMSEAQEAAEVWLTDYNEYRPHESLGDMPPAMFKPRGFQPEISTFNL